MSFFNEAAARANRLMRTKQVELNIAGLRDQQRKLATDIGMKVLEAYRQGKAADPELLPSFQSYDALEQQIAQRESEKKALETEGTPAAAQPQAAPAAATVPAYGHLCSKERTPIPAQAAFCPNCGAPAVDVPAPAPAAPANKTCSSCGVVVPAGAAFCPNCGAAQPH